MVPAVLTIAGSDSGAGAGLQADIRTLAAHGVHGATAVTAVTAQNTRSVTAVDPVSPRMVAAQICAVFDDFEIAAVKTGMLATAAIVEAVCEALEAQPGPPLVVDPVIAATSGRRLLDEDGVRVMGDRLLRRARVVTPNRFEAEVWPAAGRLLDTRGGPPPDPGRGRGRHRHRGPLRHDESSTCATTAASSSSARPRLEAGSPRHRMPFRPPSRGPGRRPALAEPAARAKRYVEAIRNAAERPGAGHSIFLRNERQMRSCRPAVRGDDRAARPRSLCAHGRALRNDDNSAFIADPAVAVTTAPLDLDARVRRSAHWRMSDNMRSCRPRRTRDDRAARPRRVGARRRRAAADPVGPAPSSPSWARPQRERGATVLRLEYEGYEPLARRAPSSAIGPEVTRWRCGACIMAGHARIGEASVIIAVAATHRADAFAAAATSSSAQADRAEAEARVLEGGDVWTRGDAERTTSAREGASGGDGESSPRRGRRLRERRRIEDAARECRRAPPNARPAPGGAHAP